jgi:excisionase family DNA binding protein
VSALVVRHLEVPTHAQNDEALSRDEVLTVDEGAKLLRVGRNQLYEAIGRGTVPHMRIGRSIRLLRSALVRSLSRSW